MRARLLWPLLLLAGCSCEEEKPPTPPRPAPKPVAMTKVTWGRLEFALPTAWKDQRRFAADGRQILFDGPRDRGEPTVSLFWVSSQRTLQDWADFQRKKYDFPGSPGIVRGKGWTTAGGKRAYFMVYELDRNRPTPGPDGGTHLTIDWYFQHDGHVGFLRCTSTKEYFPSGYRPLFERIAASLRFLPRPR